MDTRVSLKQALKVLDFKVGISMILELNLDEP